MQINGISQQTNFESAYIRDYGYWKLFGGEIPDRVPKASVRQAFSSASKKVGLLLTDSNTSVKIVDTYTAGNFRVRQPVILTENDAEKFCRLSSLKEKMDYLNNLFSKGYRFSEGLIIDESVPENLFLRYLA